MTNGECIYHKTVDYMSRMAFEEDDFRRFSVILEFRVTEIGSRRALHQRENGPLNLINCLKFCETRVSAAS